MIPVEINLMEKYLEIKYGDSIYRINKEIFKFVLDKLLKYYKPQMCINVDVCNIEIIKTLMVEMKLLDQTFLCELSKISKM